MKNLKKNLVVLCSLVILSFCFNQDAYAILSNEGWKLWYPDYKLISNMNDVPTDKNFIINFSSEVKKESIFEGGIEITDVNMQRVSVNFNFLSEKRVQAVPKEKLEEGKVYYLLMHKSIKGAYNNPIEQGVVSVINVKKNSRPVQPISPEQRTKEQEEFINEVAKGAIESYNKYGVYPSVTIAQAIHESGWGKSDKASECNNIFGIKADKTWTGPTKEFPTQEWISGAMVPVMAKWRVYPSIEDCIDDHGKFLCGRKNYLDAGVFKAANYLEQITAIKKAGYATDPQYVRKVCNYIEKYELWKYDTDGKVIPMND